MAFRKIRGVRRLGDQECIIEDRIIKGLIFCHVVKIKMVGHCKFLMT